MQIYITSDSRCKGLRNKICDFFFFLKKWRENHKILCQSYCYFERAKLSIEASSTVSCYSNVKQVNYVASLCQRVIIRCKTWPLIVIHPLQTTFPRCTPHVFLTERLSSLTSLPWSSAHTSHLNTLSFSHIYSNKVLLEQRNNNPPSRLPYAEKLMRKTLLSSTN